MHQTRSLRFRDDTLTWSAGLSTKWPDCVLPTSSEWAEKEERFRSIQHIRELLEGPTQPTRFSLTEAEPEGPAHFLILHDAMFISLRSLREKGADSLENRAALASKPFRRLSEVELQQGGKGLKEGRAKEMHCNGKEGDRSPRHRQSTVALGPEPGGCAGS